MGYVDTHPPHDRELLFAGILLLSSRMQTTYDRRLAELTLKQWLALVVVARLPRPVESTAKVAEVLGGTHQNATKLLASLAEKGYLSLTPSPRDARARQIDLTPRAEEFFAREAELGQRLLEDLYRGITPRDISTAFGVLDRMSRNLTGDALTPPAPEA